MYPRSYLATKYHPRWRSISSWKRNDPSASIRWLSLWSASKRLISSRINQLITDQWAPRSLKEIEERARYRLNLKTILSIRLKRLKKDHLVPTLYLRRRSIQPSRTHLSRQYRRSLAPLDYQRESHKLIYIKLHSRQDRSSRRRVACKW